MNTNFITNIPSQLPDFWNEVPTDKDSQENFFRRKSMNSSFAIRETLKKQSSYNNHVIFIGMDKDYKMTLAVHMEDFSREEFDLSTILPKMKDYNVKFLEMHHRVLPLIIPEIHSHLLEDKFGILSNESKEDVSDAELNLLKEIYDLEAMQFHLNLSRKLKSNQIDLLDVVVETPAEDLSRSFGGSSSSGDGKYEAFNSFSYGSSISREKFPGFPGRTSRWSVDRTIFKKLHDLQPFFDRLTCRDKMGLKFGSLYKPKSGTVFSAFLNDDGFVSHYRGVARLNNTLIPGFEKSEPFEIEEVFLEAKEKEEKKNCQIELFFIINKSDDEFLTPNKNDLDLAERIRKQSEKHRIEIKNIILLGSYNEQLQKHNVLSL